MKQQFFQVLLFILCNLSITKAENSNLHFGSKFVFDYLQNYTRLTIQHVVFAITSTSNEIEHELIQDTIEMLLQQNIFQFTSVSKFSKNVTSMFQKLEKTEFPSIVVFPNVDKSREAQKAFFKIPKYMTRKNLWLLVFTINFKTDEAMNKYVEGLMNKHPYVETLLSLPSSVFIVTQINGKRQLAEVYKQCKENNLLIWTIVKFNYDNSISSKIRDRPIDLKGCTIRVGYMDYAPTLTIISNNDQVSASSGSITRAHDDDLIIEDRQLALTGSKAKLFSLLQSQLNFSIKWILVSDLSFGTYDDMTNTWNGIVGMIQRNEIDTSIIDLSITVRRMDVVSFSIPIARYRTYLFYENLESDIGWDLFSSVMPPKYKITMISFIFILITYHFMLVLRLSHIEGRNLSLKEKSSRYFHSLCLCLCSVAGIDVPQMAPAFRKIYISHRIIVLIIAFYGIIHYYIYNSLLISRMMVPRHHTPIKDIKDILAKPEYKLLVFGGTSNMDYLKYSTEEDFKKIWKKTVRENGVLSLSNNEYLKTIASNLDYNIIFAEFPTFQHEMSSYQHAKCNIKKSEIGYNFQYGAYPFAKSSPYRHVFDHYIGKFLGGRLKTTHSSAEYEEECMANQKSFKTMSYKEVIYPFAIFIFACIIAVQISFAEYFYFSGYICQFD